jgi:hypothetical protein
MVIEYFLEYRNQGYGGATCCGEFDTFKEFLRFVVQQEYEGKAVTKVRLLRS